jgi:hypothetical protein
MSKKSGYLSTMPIFLYARSAANRYRDLKAETLLFSKSESLLWQKQVKIGYTLHYT